jgi:hypothetical protein
MIFICLTIVDFPDSPEPVGGIRCVSAYVEMRWRHKNKSEGIGRGTCVCMYNVFGVGREQCAR